MDDAREPEDKACMVLIKWDDARFYTGIRKKEAIQDCRMAVFESLGYLLSQDATTTVIAAECNDEGEFRDITLIPSGSIRCIRRLAIGSLM